MSVRRLLNQHDGDPYSPTRGCFDRRFWGWKLIDFPEATFQRNVQPLAEVWADPRSPFYRDPTVLDAVITGLDYSSSIQHADGSFDQAFPNERSYAGTGFLLHSLCEAYKLIRPDASGLLREKVAQCLKRAADFLCRHDEKHGIISNHLAGVIVSLIKAADLLGREPYRARALSLLKQLLEQQSSEGWFLEYDGADPGYQTLCLYYLAQIYLMEPSSHLERALENAVDFLSHFVHPDGTFGGEYGSRRTTIYYPGGVALLSQQFPMAFSMTKAMVCSIAEGDTTTLVDIDMGNLAPLLANYLCLVQAKGLEENSEPHPLPWEQPSIRKDFPEAGIVVRGTGYYYAIFGASNGGVMKVLHKRRRRLIWDDSGYIGETSRGVLVTTQMTIPGKAWVTKDDRIEGTRSFYRVLHSLPSPLRFLLLRGLCLTLMRNLRIGNLIKRGLVRLLISGKSRCDIQLQRRVRFEPDKVVVEDRLSKSHKVELRWLQMGRRFVGIHMASARYFQGREAEQSPPKIDLDSFNQQHQIDLRIVIDCA